MHKVKFIFSHAKYATTNYYTQYLFHTSNITKYYIGYVKLTLTKYSLLFAIS